MACGKSMFMYEPVFPLSGIKFKNGLSWEMDGAGWHRIVSPDGSAGDWVPYQSIAVSSDSRYLCVSQYYGCLPERVDPEAPPDILSETLYEIKPIARVE